MISGSATYVTESENIRETIAPTRLTGMIISRIIIKSTLTNTTQITEVEVEIGEVGVK